MDCKFNTELGLVTVSDEVLVRVAGYLAYFVELDTDVQEALIARTAHKPD